MEVSILLGSSPSVSSCELGFMYLGSSSVTLSSSCESLVWFGGFYNGGFRHSSGGTWRFGFLSSMESVSYGGRFKKGGRSGTGTLHRLRGLTNGGHRGLGGPLDSPSRLPHSCLDVLAY